MDNIQTRLATPLEKKHFSELTKPIFDLMANPPGHSMEEAAKELERRARTLSAQCERFGYFPSPIALRVRVESDLIHFDLTEQQRIASAKDMQSLFDKLLGKDK